MNERMKFKNLRKLETYSKPGSVEIGLIEAGDDFLDEVSSGTEMSSLSEQQRRFLRVVQTRPDVQDRLQVTVYPIISRHLSIHRKMIKVIEGKRGLFMATMKTRETVEKVCLFV